MMKPFITLAINILLGPERPLVQHHLRALINHGARVATERHAVLLAFEKVLPHFGPYLFEQKAQMRGDRVVSQNRVALLQEIANTEQGERSENKNRNQNEVEHLAVHDPQSEQ